jgi:peptide/nickel transport system substrate-binding protein
MKRRLIVVFTVVIIISTLTACDRISDTAIPSTNTVVAVSGSTSTPAPPSETPEPTLTSKPPRALTICMGQEPSSLFLYGDSTAAARGVLQAIYDGPFDVYQYQVRPVLLQKVPSLADGDASLQPVQVELGSLIIDTDGNLVSLSDGVRYRPSGCTESACALNYTGGDPVTMDELVVHFQLIPGIHWSDGTPLTADDSVYSFEVLSGLFGSTSPDTLRYTQNYTALDELTVEWRGVPGYQGALYRSNFFTPLPRHVWGGMSDEDLLVADVSTHSPLGWGPYIMEEWVAGDHITMKRNPNYFRSGEGLPYFDFLVYRFMEADGEALDALLAGECDFIDRTAMLEDQIPRLLELEEAGRLKLAFQTGTAWEQVAFGINSFNEARQPIFDLKEVRQAIAMCIDREAISAAHMFGDVVVPDTYVQPAHPLHNPEVRRYEFDPEAASALLESSGWLDHDQDVSTPRISQSVPGVLDGTPFSFVYLASDDVYGQVDGQMVKESLARCGIQVEVNLQTWSVLMEPGPEGPVFGRQFDMAQFAWATAWEPACYLFESDEVPGPYPDFPKGWGGGNPTGFSNPDFDQACRQTRFSLPDVSAYQEAHAQAQSIFAEELPALPLYFRQKVMVMRPDMCGVEVDPAGNRVLESLESFDFGDNCQD